MVTSEFIRRENTKTHRLSDEEMLQVKQKAKDQIEDHVRRFPDGSWGVGEIHFKDDDGEITLLPVDQSKELMTELDQYRRKMEHELMPRELPRYGLGRQEAEDLVDMLESCKCQKAQMGMDWRLELADELRKQWGMISREEEPK